MPGRFWTDRRRRGRQGEAQLRPAAREDILRQFRYYLEEGTEETARRFLDAVGDTFQRLLEYPEIGSPRAFSNPALMGLRSWPVQGFPATRIYYLVAEHSLRIVRILHGKRDVSGLLEEESTEPEL